MNEREDEPPAPDRRLTRSELRARKVERANFKAKTRTPITLVLDGVLGNYNQGALFRLADAFLLEALHFCGTTLEPWHRRFTKSARGTFKWVPHSSGKDISSVLSEYQNRGYQIVVVEQCDGSTSLYETEFTTPTCIVLGGELSGVSPAAIQCADTVVEVPTMGMANSLNVAMTAGIIVAFAYRSVR